MRLLNKVALITGSESGIGRAIALRFAREGATIIAHSAQNDCAGSSIVQEIRALGREAIAIEADVRSEEAVQQMVHTAISAFARIDILVNSAGAHTFLDRGTDVEKLKHLIDVDVKGTFLCCRAVAPLMQAQGQGCIINMSWDYALIEGMKSASIFAAAKGAVHSLSMCLAQELAPQIRVNTIAPGWLEMTPIAEQAAPFLVPPEDIPLQRAGEPGDAAEAALYLADSAASYITGQTIVVNGGRSMF